MAVGIIGAMDVEIELLKERMTQSGALEYVSSGSLQFAHGYLADYEVFLVQCGVGMVNAAVATTVLTSVFNVEAVINTGVAGSLDPCIDIGDIVVATDVVNHVMDVCNLGYKPGQTPGLENVAFACDPNLADIALSSAASLGYATHRGRVASVDYFVRSEADKKRIAELFGASCCEMEGAAIAQVCTMADTPFVILRAISDKADGTDHIDYPLFEKKAARYCAELTCNMLSKL